MAPDYPKKPTTMLTSDQSKISLDVEKHLSDDWAKSVDVNTIDVAYMNESPTIPEIRHIMRALGDIRGKRIIDLGCGLGETSVYFALKGARVTAVDLSPEMLKVVDRLSRRYHVRVRKTLASVEHLSLKKNEKFDVVYAGNLFHHVSIPATMASILPHMHKDSVLVCWDPVRYNPIINIYRKIAVNVRSPGERPFGLTEIRYLRQYFRESTVSWYWLTSLLIFIYMYLIERRNPNTERYWKAVIMEGRKWSWLYLPLSALDRIILTLLPFLRPLCWNVILVLQKPHLSRRNVYAAAVR